MIPIDEVLQHFILEFKRCVNIIGTHLCIILLERSAESAAMRGNLNL